MEGCDQTGYGAGCGLVSRPHPPEGGFPGHTPTSTVGGPCPYANTLNGSVTDLCGGVFNMIGWLQEGVR